jgi:hypothetical protein
MEKEFIPYELALRMKQLGFDIPTFGYYQSTRLKLQFPLLKSETQTQTYMRKEDCSAPTFQQAFRWFREKYGLYSYLSPKLSYPDDTITGKYYINILCNKFDYDVDNDGVYLYEEAELACLEKLIEIVEQSKSE